MISLIGRITLVTSQIAILLLYSNTLSVNELSQFNSIMVAILFILTITFHPFDVGIQKKVYSSGSSNTMQSTFIKLHRYIIIISILFFIFISILNTYNIVSIIILIIFSTFTVQSLKTAVMNKGNIINFNIIVISESVIKLLIVFLLMKFQALNLFSLMSSIIISNIVTSIFVLNYMMSNKFKKIDDIINIVGFFDRRIYFRSINNFFHWVSTNGFKFLYIFLSYEEVTAFGFTLFALGSSAMQSLHAIIIQYTHPIIHKSNGSDIGPHIKAISLSFLGLLFFYFYMSDYVFKQLFRQEFENFYLFFIIGALFEFLNSILGVIGLRLNYNKKEKYLLKSYIYFFPIFLIIGICVHFTFNSFYEYISLFYLTLVVVSSIIMLKMSKVTSDDA